MPIRLIAVDMDGTFLDDEKQIPRENLEAFRCCAQKGIHLVPATGRIPMGVPEELRTLPGVRYVISANGACIYDYLKQQEIASCRMEPSLAAFLMELARDSGDDIMYDAYLDGIGCTTAYFYENIGRYTESRVIEALIRRTRRVVGDNISYIKTKNRPVDKVNMFFPDLNARSRMRERLREVPGIVVASSLTNNLEINARGADKGSALLRLAACLGVAAEETMAFGDGENDQTMIEAAGIGVAMENAVPALRGAADYITAANNEAGVARAIERFILKRKD